MLCRACEESNFSRMCTVHVPCNRGRCIIVTVSASYCRLHHYGPLSLGGANVAVQTCHLILTDGRRQFVTILPLLASCAQAGRATL
jgi:hypothetical protein